MIADFMATSGDPVEDVGEGRRVETDAEEGRQRPVTPQHLKHVELRNLCCRDLDHLSVELNLAVKRLRKRPSVIQSFFAGAGLDI